MTQVGEDIAGVKGRLRGGAVLSSFVVVAVAALIATAISFKFAGSGGWQYDLGVYRQGAQALADGRSLYDQGKFTYPPFAAIIMQPLLLSNLNAVGSAWVFVSTIALGMALLRLLSLGQLGPQKMRLLAAAVLMIALSWSEPGRTSLMLGQVTSVILLAFAWDMSLPADSRWRGVAIGLVTGLKIIPGIFVLLLALTGHRKAAARVSLTFVATVGLSLLVTPRDTVSYWTHWIFDTARVGSPRDIFSESMTSMLVRWGSVDDLHRSVGLALGIAFGLGCVVVSVALWKRQETLLSVTACSLAMVTAPPIAWTFYWLWVLAPLACWLVVLLRGSRNWASVVALIAGGVLFALAPSDGAAQHRRTGALSLEQLAMTSTRFAAALAIFLFLLVYCRRSSRSMK